MSLAVTTLNCMISPMSSKFGGTFPFFLELAIEEALRFLAVPIQHDFDEDLEAALNLEELVNEHNDACADEEEGAAP